MRVPAEEILREVDLALLGSRQIGEIEGRDPEHLAGAFAVRGSDDWSVDPEETAVVEEAMQAGLTDLGFVTGRNKRAIADHFDMSYELEKEIEGTGKEQYLAGINEVMER